MSDNPRTNTSLLSDPEVADLAPAPEVEGETFAAVTKMCHELFIYGQLNNEPLCIDAAAMLGTVARRLDAVPARRRSGLLFAAGLRTWMGRVRFAARLSWR